MFGIGMPEMLLILAIALIVIGPKKLPDLAKSLGRAMGEFKKATSEIKQSIGADADFKEVKETFTDIQKDIRGTVSFDNIEEYQPDPGKSVDRAPSTSPDFQNKETAATDETLGNLKQAFDQMNQKDAEPPTDDKSESDSTGSSPDAMKEEPDRNERG